MLTRRALIVGAPAVIAYSRLGYAQITPHDHELWTGPRVTDELLMKLAPAITRADAERALRPYRAFVRDYFFHDHVVWVKCPGEDAEELALKLESEQIGLFEEILPNSISKPQLVPNDPDYPGNGGPGSQDYLTVMNCAAAWGKYGFLQGRSGIPPVVDINSGCGPHNDINGNLQTGYNTEDGTSNIADVDTVFYHGTGCGGQVASVTNNSVGMAGVGGGGPLVPILVFPYDVGHMITGLNWIVSNVPAPAIINSSIGWNASFSTYKNLLQTMWNSGYLFFQATGDTGSLTCAFSGWSDSPYVISVSAVNNDLSRASYASYGPSKAGTGIGGIVSGCAPATGLWLDWGSPANSYNGANTGCSFTSPQWAAAAQYLMANFPKLKNYDVAYLAANSANGQTVTGFSGVSAPFNNPACLDLDKLCAAAAAYRGIPTGGRSLLGRR